MLPCDNMELKEKKYIKRSADQAVLSKTA